MVSDKKENMRRWGFYDSSYLEMIYGITGIRFIDSEEVLSLQIAEVIMANPDAREIAIARKLGMSRTPVRNQLKRYKARIYALAELMRKGQWPGEEQ